MKIQKLLLFITLLFALNTVPLTADTSFRQKSFISKVLGAIGQSKPMYWFEKYVEAKVPKPIPMGDEPASPEYQALGKEAQSALEIPEERQVPIKKILPTNPLAEFVGGVAEPEAIYVNETKLNERTYGMRRCALFHEAVHKKYCDQSFSDVVGIGTLIGSSIITHKIIQALKTPGKHKILHGLGVVCAGFMACVGSCLVYQNYYIERRADIEGHYATQCSVCVHESAQRRKVSFEEENNPLKYKGYLRADDLEKIALDLEQEHKFCAYHQNVTEKETK